MTSSSPRSSTYCRLAATKESYVSCSGADIVRSISDELPLSRFMSLEEAQQSARDSGRRGAARKGGYLPPPREKDSRRQKVVTTG